MKIILTIVAVFLLAATISLAQQHPSVGGYNVYYGHLHNHCGYSDGTGSPSDAYSYAKEQSDLDFFGLSDHAELLTKKEYEGIIEAANLYNEDGVHTTFYGFEWTSARYGHVSVFNTTDYKSSGLWIFYSFNSILKWMNKRDCVGFFNHPGFPVLSKEFNHFRDNPTEKMVGIELWNGNGTFKKYYYNDGYFEYDGNKGYYDEALVSGWKIGAAGSEDNHNDNWGNMNDYRLAILSNKLTRQDLYGALQARRFFSTLDKNLAMSFKINGSEMGSEIAADSLNIQVLLNDTDNEYFKKVELLKNGAVIKSWDINEQTPAISYITSGIGNDYFYIRCKQVDGDEAISSPVFISGNTLKSTPVADKNASINQNVIRTKEPKFEEDKIKVTNEINFKVYPNPSKGELVYIKLDKVVEGLKVIVIDINGKVVTNKLVDKNTLTLPALNSGTYIVTLTDGVNTSTQTLIVQ